VSNDATTHWTSAPVDGNVHGILQISSLLRLDIPVTLSLAITTATQFFPSTSSRPASDDAATTASTSDFAYQQPGSPPTYEDLGSGSGRQPPRPVTRPWSGRQARRPGWVTRKRPSVAASTPPSRPCRRVGPVRICASYKILMDVLTRTQILTRQT
jgi:hypothetical protein